MSQMLSVCYFKHCSLFPGVQCQPSTFNYVHSSSSSESLPSVWSVNSDTCSDILDASPATPYVTHEEVQSFLDGLSPNTSVWSVNSREDFDVNSWKDVPLSEAQSSWQSTSDETDLHPQYPLSPVILIEEFGELSDDSDDGGSVQLEDDWGAAYWSAKSVCSESSDRDNVDELNLVETLSLSSGMRSDVGVSVASNKDCDEVEDLHFTPYEESIIRITLEMYREKNSIRKKKGHFSSKEELYKDTSAKYWKNMRRQLEEKVVECAIERKRIERELKICEWKKKEVKMGCVDLTDIGKESGITTKDMLENVEAYKGQLKEELKTKEKPWQVRLGLNDETRQLKRIAREELNLTRPWRAKVADYLVHKCNKLVNGRKYDAYKKL